MKKFTILLSSLALTVLLAVFAYSDDRRLMYDGFDNLTDINAAPATGDFVPLMDTSANDVKKIDMADLGINFVSGVTAGTSANSKALVLDSSGNIDLDETDYEKFLGPNQVTVATVGTWTITRTAQALVNLTHTDADDTSVLLIDILPDIRIAAGKGFQLNTMDVIFENATADLDAHSATLDRVVYVDSTVEAVTSLPITGTLAVGQDADPQVDVLTVTTPGFEVTTLSKVVLEITVDAAATSVFKFHGVVLNFTRENH